MKKLLLLLTVITTLMSCGRDYEQVKLPNGSFVKAINNTDMHYAIGQRVCINKTSNSTWSVCEDGEMQDTTTFHTFNGENGKRTFISTHKTGLISSHL
jgi:hypothetical protein